MNIRISTVIRFIVTLSLSPIGIATHYAWAQDPGYTPITATSGVLTAPSTFSAIEMSNGISDLAFQQTLARQIVCLDGAGQNVAVSTINNAPLYYGPWMETVRQQVQSAKAADMCPRGWRGVIDSVRTYLPAETPAYLMNQGKVFVKRSARDFGTDTQVDDYYPGGAKTMADLQKVIRSERWNVSILNSPFLSLDQKRELRAKIEAGDGERIEYYGPVMLNSGALSKASAQQIATGAHRRYFLLIPKAGEKPVMVFRFRLSDGSVVDIPEDCANIDHHAQMRQVFVSRIFLKEDDAARCRYNKDLLATDTACHAPVIAITEGNGWHCKLNNVCGVGIIGTVVGIGIRSACLSHFVICKENDSPKKSEGNHGTPTLSLFTIPLRLGGN